MTYMSKDLDIINAVLRRFPAARDIIDGLKALGADVAYPIDSSLALQTDADTTGEPNIVLDVLAQAPAYYFPIPV